MTQTALFSEHWYRVRGLHVALADDVEFRPHVYRGRRWWVLHRRSARSTHRVDETTFRVIACLNDARTLGDVWEECLASFGEDAPTQNQFVNLVSELHEAQLLSVDRKLNAERLFARGEEARQRELRQRFINPLFMRFALLDPDRLLTRATPLGRLLFDRPGYVTLTVLMLTTLGVLAPQLEQLLAEAGALDWASPVNAMALLLIYPLMKLAHETAHGMAVKRFGGEVHEVGISLLVLLPVPYIDASAASLFSDKGRRMLVAAAGILAELGLAAAAGLIWAASSPGVVHDIALMVLFVGTLSTLLFNANPLLKFDGYFVLADWAELPNLAERSRAWWLQFSRRVLFGLPDTQPSAPVDEVRWLAIYGALAATYRLVLTVSIALMLGSAYFLFGVVLAVWVLATGIGLPLLRFLRFLTRTPTLNRARAATVCGLATVLIVGGLGMLPMRNAVVTDGVVWLPDNAIVRAPLGCEITRTMVASQSPVNVDDPLFHCDNPALTTLLRVVQAQQDELAAESAGLQMTDRLNKTLIETKQSTLTAQYANTRDQLASLEVRAGINGTFVPAEEPELTGRYLRQGELAAYVIPAAARTIRVALEQNDGDALASTEPVIAVRLPDAGGSFRAYPVRLLRHSPRTLRSVPSVSLTTAGGGPLTADPEGDGLAVLEPVYDLELDWPAGVPALPIGRHVSVRLEREPKTVFSRLYAATRRTFLEQFGA
ncbi:MAG: hypothetical protein H6993_11990 [Pseudomonadales bacterium]|nr:hypothetical protein [Pseudomonadales bacterium]